MAKELTLFLQMEPVTFVPEKSFTGTASGVTVKRVDKNGTEITAKYTPTVTPVTPTATPTTSTDIQGATQLVSQYLQKAIACTNE